MKPHIRLKSIAAGVTAAAMITAISATNAAASGKISSTYRGTYHEINNSDAFVTFREDEVILVAYYYKVNSSEMYIRDVIKTISIASGSGTTNVTFSKDKVRCCTSDGTYLDDDDVAGYCINFVSQGKFESTSEFTAHGKTYCK